MTSYEISEELVKLLNEIFTLFSQNTDLIQKGFTDKDRYYFAKYPGEGGKQLQTINIFKFIHREKGLCKYFKTKLSFLNLCLIYIDNTIEKNRRDDGLFHSYNLISFKGEEISIRTLV